jgi:hypothetical protein
MPADSPRGKGKEATMAGYDWANGMSSNAVRAYQEGKMPKTKAVAALAKRYGLTRKAAREIVEEVGRCEWHHSSKYFHETDFYDLAACAKRIEAQPVLDALNALPYDWRAELDPAFSLQDFAARRAAVAQVFEDLAAAVGSSRELVENLYYADWNA